MKKKSSAKTRRTTKRAPKDHLIAELAKQIINEITESGRKNHPEGSWYHETEDYHLFKATGHINSAQQLRDGYRKPDGEGDLSHLKNALCRIAMALGKRLLKPAAR